MFIFWCTQRTLENCCGIFEDHRSLDSAHLTLCKVVYSIRSEVFNLRNIYKVVPLISVYKSIQR